MSTDRVEELDVLQEVDHPAASGELKEEMRNGFEANE